MRALSKEKALFLAIVAIALLYPLEHALLGYGLTGVALSFAAILAVILAAAFSVAHHAELLAHKYGEPYGTLILTGSAVSVEVIMLAILMQSSDNPTLVRDTIYSALMLDINGILGVAAIIGGIKHGEQKYNVDSSNSYIAMILVAVGVSMFIPDFINQDAWRLYSVFTIVVMITMYVVFTRIQTVDHRYFFEYKYGTQRAEGHPPHEVSGAYHGLMLFLLIAAIGVLAELLSVFLNAGIRQTGLPLTLAAVLVALISASPEILTAIRAAVENRMQTVINIALGASLATVLMTVPVIEAISLITHTDIIMGLTPLQAAMILTTMLVAMINFNDGETNSLEGLVHFVLFLAFAVLIFLVPEGGQALPGLEPAAGGAAQ
ncbi:MAG: calcium:proton antiporter [Pseudomonadota bacterium]